MKKFLILPILLLTMLLLTGCSMKREYESIESLDDGSKLKWGEVTYSFYGAVSNPSNIMGDQIFIVDQDDKWKIYDVKGYNREEWIIEYYDVIMSTYSLYKSDNVEEIPEELRLD